MKQTCLFVSAVFVVLFAFSTCAKARGLWLTNDKNEVRLVPVEKGWYPADGGVASACDKLGEAVAQRPTSIERVDFFHHVTISNFVVCNGMMWRGGQKKSEEQFSWYILLVITAMVVMVMSVWVKVKGKGGLAVTLTTVTAAAAAFAFAATYVVVVTIITVITTFAAAIAVVAAISGATLVNEERQTPYWASVLVFFIATVTLLLFRYAF